MAYISFDAVVAQWIDEHTWPRAVDNPQSILELTAANDAGTVFKFRSGFSYFEISGTYNKATSSLADVQIRLVVPGKPDSTILTEVDLYPLSTNEGDPIIFNLDYGYVAGKVSFKYGVGNGTQDIFVTYAVTLPFAGDLEDTIDIAPTLLSKASGFTTAQLKAIPPLTPSELKLVEGKAQSDQVAIRDIDEDTANQQALLVKFLKDFVVGVDGVIIETYYAPPGARATNLPGSGFSTQWEGSISFLGILELVASIDPTTLAISSVLYAKIPIVDRVRLTRIEGSLLGGGVSGDINVVFGNGKATFTAAKGSSGKYELFVEAYLDVKFIGQISTNGKVCLLTLPF